MAVTGNVTVTGQNAAGYVARHPDRARTTRAHRRSTSRSATTGPTTSRCPSRPTGSSSATYKAATGKTTDLVFDVTGYFLPDDSGATYHASRAPVRAARFAAPGSASPGTQPKRFVARAPQTFQIGTGRRLGSRPRRSRSPAT